MKVWVVFADDHDYDCMSQWLVGVFATEEDAIQAARKDRNRYAREGDRSRYNSEIYETTLGEIYVGS